MGFLDRLTWKELLFIGGILIIWAFAGFAIIDAFGRNALTDAGFALFLGIVFTGALLIIIAVVDKIL